MLLALPSVLLLERAWDRRWMTDDGFINLRVVRMILDGHGPVFNAGERVEVATSTLWLWILTAGDVLLPLRLEWVAICLGLVFAVGGLALATFGAARLHRTPGAQGLLVPAGALVLAVVSPVWDFSTSGLEGGLVFGWLGLVMGVLGRWAGSERGLGVTGAVIVGLGPLVRPDLALVSGVVLAAVLAASWPQDGGRDRLRVLAAAAALPVAYQVFRMGYYGSLVPNAALAKAGGRSRWSTGFDYLRDLVQPYWLVAPAAALVLAVLLPAVARAARRGDRRVVAALGALPVAGLLDMLYVVRVGGDYMHGRLLLPAFFALLAPVATVPLPSRRAAPDSREIPGPDDGAAPRAWPALSGAAVGLALVWSLTCLAWLRPPAGSAVEGLFSSDARAGNVAQFGEHAVTVDDQGWGPDTPHAELDPNAAVFVEGRPIAVDPPADLAVPAVAGYGIGIGGYVYGPEVTIIDLLGLADPIDGRFELSAPGLTGHEKPMPLAWLAARISDEPVDSSSLPESAIAHPLYQSPDRRFDADTEAARSAWSCGELSELVDAVREPMTPRRFLSNLVSAARLTMLSVPPDPAAAERRFCAD
jgi:arabinofuranosyltransferase